MSSNYLPHLTYGDRRIVFGPVPLKPHQEYTFVFIPGKGRAWRSAIFTADGDVDVVDISINRMPQLAGRVPAEIFSSKNVGMETKMDVARVGEEIKIVVQAREKDTVFIATIAGEVLS